MPPRRTNNGRRKRRSAEDIIATSCGLPKRNRSELATQPHPPQIHIQNDAHREEVDQPKVDDYQQAIYTSRRQREALEVMGNYLAHQPYIDESMRARLVDWIIKVHGAFGFHPETLFKTVNVMDRYLSRRAVGRRELQLVGLASLILASKYEQLALPKLQQFVRLSCSAYTRKQILRMESTIAEALRFNLTVPTAYTFIPSFLSVAQSDIDLEMVSRFLLELCLLESEMLEYRPSMLAAAAVYTARCILRRAPYWTTTLHRHTLYTQHDLRECAQCMVRLQRNALMVRFRPNSKPSAVYEKYNSSKFHFATRHNPPIFI